jgi:hypothetical protein
LLLVLPPVALISGWRFLLTKRKNLIEVSNESHKASWQKILGWPNKRLLALWWMEYERAQMVPQNVQALKAKSGHQESRAQSFDRSRRHNVPVGQ